MKVFKLKWALSLSLVLASSLSFGQALTTQQKIDDFNQLVQIIRSQYGPLEFKQTNKVLNFEEHVANFAGQIEASQNNAEFYQTILKFVALFHDGHFGIRTPSTHRAILPLTTDLIEGKVYITKIDRAKLTEAQFPFEVGDEVLSVDGEDVQSVMARLKALRGSGNPKTEERQAAWQLFRRSGALVTMPTKPSVQIVLRRGKTKLIETKTLNWEFLGEADDENSVTEHRSFGLKTESQFFKDLGQINNDGLMEFSRNADVDYACNPITRVAVPENAQWLLKQPFTAYIYPTAKGNVGYLRIPHYYPIPKPGQDPRAAFEEWYEATRYAVQKMQDQTVGLIIDQDHNCGGSVQLVEDITSLFVNEPVQPMQFSLRATKALYVELKQEMALLNPQSLIYETYKSIFDMVTKVWKATPGAMTEKVSLTGRSTIYPDPQVNYTKPIVILIDEIAGSGGDAFPSGMKGYGRAKLFGQQTSGLGGSVSRFPSLNNSQMMMSMTNTLFFKPDGSPVENNGAIPDREYTLTWEDIKFGYRPYQKVYTDYLLEQIP